MPLHLLGQSQLAKFLPRLKQRHEELRSLTQPTYNHQRKGNGCLHIDGELHFALNYRGEKIWSLAYSEVYPVVTESKVLISKVQCGHGLSRCWTASPSCAAYGSSSSIQEFLGNSPKPCDRAVSYSAAFKMGIPDS